MDISSSQESNKQNFQEKRQYPRIDYFEVIKCVVHDGFAFKNIQAETRNISANGILLETNTPLNVGAVICFDINTRKIDCIDQNIAHIIKEGNTLFGSVVRVHKEENSSNYRIGVKLINTQDPHDSCMKIINTILQWKKMVL